MIEKYRSEVLRHYEQKKAEGELSINLIHFTPVNIRNESRLLFSAACDNIDRRMLKEFFGVHFENEVSDLMVKKCDPDKFKPLCNFLKKGTKTHEKSIELLAWLIDFRPRPFSNYWRTSNGKADISALSITEQGVVEGKKAEPQYQPQRRLPVQIDTYQSSNNDVSQQNQWVRRDSKISNQSGLHSEYIQKEITLEYPSGVKVSVDAYDLSLIAQLVRL
jgi:hypothetical protein